VVSKPPFGLDQLVYHVYPLHRERSLEETPEEDMVGSFVSTVVVSCVPD